MTKRDLLNSISREVQDPIEQKELQVFASRLSCFTLELFDALIKHTYSPHGKDVIKILQAFTHNETIYVQPSIIRTKDKENFLYYGYKCYLYCKDMEKILLCPSTDIDKNILSSSKNNLTDSIHIASSANTHLGEVVFLYYMLQATSYPDIKSLIHNYDTNKFMTAFMQKSGFHKLYYTGYINSLSTICYVVPNMIDYINYNIRVFLDSKNKKIYFSRLDNQPICYCIDFIECGLDKISNIELIADIVTVIMTMRIGFINRTLVQDFVEDIMLR